MSRRPLGGSSESLSLPGVPPHRRFAVRHISALAIALAALPALAGCGGDPDGGTERGAPPESEFPAAKGRTLAGIATEAAKSDLVVSPAGQVVDVGTNRFAFGVFDLGGEQVDDADIALYFAPGLRGKAHGPFPARIDSLRTPAAFRSKTTVDDPAAATSVYVVDGVPIRRRGELTALALIRRDGQLEGTRLPSYVVGKFPGVPDVGEKAPRFSTPTMDEVADPSQIDTRIPPDSMHEVDYADVLGREAIMLIFATPQFCQSRVCGPTVDIAEEVKAEFGDEAAFIHMEIFNENDPNKGLRPQVRAFALPTEPWAFVIDRDGVVRERLEGAFGATELSAALEKVAR
jgi:hypothetical protein